MLPPMADASLTNIRMVRPKGPKIFLGVLALAVVGAAAWWWTRPPGPAGEPEDPSKILVVGKDADTATTLREFGFVTEHGTYEALAAEGAKEAAGTEGIEAIVHLADLRGFGYVALEDPTSHGMASLTVTGDSADVTADHAWAVFSVGDLGMPPKVTVDLKQSVLPLPAYVQVLRAAFKQDRLANTLFAENQLPMDAVDLHRKIQVAVDLHGAYAMIDRRIEREVRTRTEALVDAQQAEPAPTVLAGPMETTEVLALGDGTALSFVQGWRLNSPRDPEVSLQPSAEIELWYHPPGNTDPTQRSRCSSLRSGRMALRGTSHVASPATDALLLETAGGLELWSLDVTAAACAFTRKGKIPRAGDYEHTWGVPHASGRVLRPASPPEGVAIAVWTAGEDKPRMLPMPGCTTIGDPAWLDEDHFAVSCRWEPPLEDRLGEIDALDLYDSALPDDAEVDPDGDPGDDDPSPPEAEPAPLPPEQTWIYVVHLSDAQDPQDAQDVGNTRIVALPGTALGDYTGIYALRPVPHAKGLDLVTSHASSDQLHRVTSDGDLAALFASAEPVFAALAEADAAPAPGATRLSPTSASPPVVDELGESTPAAAAPPLLRPAFVPVGATVAALPATSLRVSTVTLPSSVDSLALSPRGTHLVYVTEDRHSVRVLPVDGKTSTTVADNPEVRYADARFTADGNAVVFTSVYDGTDRIEQVGQWASVGVAKDPAASPAGGPAASKENP